MRKSFVALIAGLAVVLGAGAYLLSIAPFFGRWGFTKSVERDVGTYYRLKVDLAYHGEPLDFDIVVGCNVKITRYKDNDRTVEVGVVPMVYGLKMADGRGIVVRPPHACAGETTENGRVPRTLLPLIVTYQNADEPWFGVAYASDEAYESSHSELEFLGATIRGATRQQWQEWRSSEAPKNFVTYQLLGINPTNPWDLVRWKPGDRFMGSQCQGFARVKLADAAREIVRAQWPADRPTYWYPNEQAGAALRKRSSSESDRPEWLFENYRVEQYDSPDYGGLPRRQPGASINHPRSVAGAIFPARTDLTPNLLEPNGRLSADVDAKPYLSWAEADANPELRGFAYCDNVANVDGLPSFINVQLNSRRIVNRINGQIVQAYPPSLAGNAKTNIGAAFERDEYVYFDRIYALVSVFGGL